MTRPGQIPILKSDSYSKSYFRHQPEISDHLPLHPYFEINNSCIWRNEITAHRLDFYMVFMLTEGEGVHAFGMKEHYVSKNMLCFVSPNMVSSWQSNTDHHKGFYCAFSDEFFNLGYENKLFLAELPLFQIDGNAILHLTDEQTSFYLELFKDMQHEFQNRSNYSGSILRSQLQLLIHKAYAQFKNFECSQPKANLPGLRLVKSFTALYQHDFKMLREGKGIQLRKVSEYAIELGVSQNHLNDTVKSITGRSAGQLIKDQLIKHATMCLMHAEKNVSEIAYALGFDDPSYFARFYKNQTGKSPSEFRGVNL